MCGFESRHPCEMTQAVVIDERVSEVENAMRSWGFKRGASGKQHTDWTKNGKLVRLKKGARSAVNQYQLKEILNILGVSRDQFFAGPPEPEIRQPIQLPVPSGNGIPVTLPSLPKPVLVDPGRELRSRPRREVVRFLHDIGGTIKDEKGHATAVLRDKLGMTVTGAPSLLMAMERDGQVARLVNGKRTFEIVLIDDGPGVQWILANTSPGLISKAGEVEAVSPVTRELVTEPEPEPLVLEQVVEEAIGKLTPADYSAIAEAIVTNLVRKLTATDREATLNAKIVEVEERLHRTVEYAKKLRSERNQLRDKYEPGQHS